MSLWAFQCVFFISHRTSYSRGSFWDLCTLKVLEPVNTFALQFLSSMIDGCVTHLVKPEIPGSFCSTFLLHKSSTISKGNEKIGWKDSSLSFAASTDGLIEKESALQLDCSCFLSVNSPLIIVIMKHHKAVMLNSQIETIILTGKP